MGSSSKKEFWKGKWKGTTLPAFHNIQISEAVKTFGKYFTPNSEVLIPLCGKSVDLIHLSKKVLTVTGIEFVQTAIDQFFTENNLEPTIQNERYVNSNIEIVNHDIFTLDLNKAFDLVLDRAALIALPKADRIKYSKVINQHLKPNGIVILTTIDIPKEKDNGPPFYVSSEEVKELYPMYETLELKSFLSKNGAKCAIYLLKKLPS